MQWLLIKIEKKKTLIINQTENNLTGGEDVNEREREREAKFSAIQCNMISEYFLGSLFNCLPAYSCILKRFYD